MLFTGNWAPAGWAFCDGQIMPIAEYDTLFNLIGTTYGGDGTTTFALPDLRGRVPVNQGAGPGLTPRTLGESGGQEAVTLTANELPTHNHLAAGSSAAGSQTSPAGGVWDATTGDAYAEPGGQSAPMAAALLSPVGSSQPHDNMPPFVTATYCIALYGIYPSPE